MNVGSNASAHAAQVQNTQSLAVLQKVMSAQKLEGQAALKLIDTAQQAQAPRPAAEPYTGTVVDVTA